MDPGPIWLSQAAWDGDEERLVLADPGSARIYIYDRFGRLQRRIARPGRGPLEFEKPNLPFRIGNRYLIAASPYRWIWLDEEFEPSSGWALEWEEQENREYARLAPYEVATDGKNLYSIGAVQRHDGQWSDWGVFAVPLNGPRAFRQLARIAKDDEERGYYLAPASNLAACGERVYLLRMAVTVSIEQLGHPARSLASFPPEFRRRPSVPPLTIDSLPARQAALRQTAVAEGLFCSDGQWLLLLAHRPRAQGGTEWLIYPIDPSRDAIGDPIELPTRAAEIVFVPGRKRWAVLEKSPMKRTGVQPVTRMVTFNRPALTPARHPIERRSP